MDSATTKSGFSLGGMHFSRRDLIYLSSFYLGFPTALALLMGAAESGSFSFVEKRYFFYYFLAATLPAWWAKDICTRLVKAVLKPWNPPLLLVLVCGSILGMNLQGVWTPLRHSLFTPYLAEGSSFFSVFPWRYSEPEYLTEALIAWATGSFIWIAVNVFYIYFLGYPRYGYSAAPLATRAQVADTVAVAAPAEPAAPSPGPSILLEKLPGEIGTDIVALKAEEHYTRVYTRLGETLVLIRFSDAVALLDELGGLQTHRSYWANPAYIDELVREGRSSHLHLNTGLDIPVSRSFRVKVQEALAAGTA